MSGQWKPGDVAMVNDCTRPNDPWRAATCIAARTPTRETTWMLHDNGGQVWGSVTDARPLLVIDPESDRDIAQVENALEAAGCRVGTNLQAALRSLIAPPIEEPTGRYAIVKADGVMFCRAAWASSRPWSRLGTTDFCDWAEMDVESVEFEGIQ